MWRPATTLKKGAIPKSQTSRITLKTKFKKNEKKISHTHINSCLIDKFKKRNQDDIQNLIKCMM